MLETGIKAPAFTLPDQNGDMKSLEDYRGQKVILCLYKKRRGTITGSSFLTAKMDEKDVDYLNVEEYLAGLGNR